MPIKRFLIQGIVQGVGFRYFVRRAARDLGLEGHVRNLADGSVEAVARGDTKQLAALEAALWRGPSASRVDSVSVENHTGDVGQGEFSIR
jgi:acylphosphatase